MTYTVEVRRIGADLAQLMSDMRTWLDHNSIEPESFQHSTGCPGLAFRVGFQAEPQAAAFADAFGGRVEQVDPAGGPQWVVRPAARRKTARDAVPVG